MKDSKIQWTDHTFNPWHGCVKVSEGCKNCYAETLSRRLGRDIWGADKPRKFFGEKYWREPLTWNAEARAAGEMRRVFCASMADVFEEREDLDYERLKLWPIVEQTEYLDWLLLTKRPENAHKMFPARWTSDGFPRNVWFGFSAENQRRFDERMAALMGALSVMHRPRVLFISAEPLLGPINMGDYLGDWPFVDWVIIGGESGRGARPLNLDWIRTLRDQVAEEGAAVFVKQLGSVWSRENKAGDSKGGLVDEWPEDLRVREMP